MVTVDIFRVMFLLGIGHGASHGSQDVQSNLRVESLYPRKKVIEDCLDCPVVDKAGSMDLVLVHCSEHYDLKNSSFNETSRPENRIDEHAFGREHGERHGFSYVVNALARYNDLKFRRVVVYEKCNSKYGFGRHVERVDGRAADFTTDFEKRSFVTPYELTYLQHISENYDNLADWTVFVHGFPEDHNKHMLEWLAAFRRPNTSDPMYISLGTRWVDREMSIYAQVKMQIVDEMKIDGQIQERVFGMANAQFMVSRRAIRMHRKRFWKNLESLFFSDKRPLNDVGIASIKDPQPPLIGDVKASEGAAEAERAKLAGAVEMAWPVIFGRPANDKKPDEQFYCEWFENITFSPCGGGIRAFDDCWRQSSCPA